MSEDETLTLQDTHNFLSEKGLIEKADEDFEIIPEEAAKEVNDIAQLTEIREENEAAERNIVIKTFLDQRLGEEVERMQRRLDELEVAEFRLSEAKKNERFDK